MIYVIFRMQKMPHVTVPLSVLLLLTYLLFISIAVQSQIEIQHVHLKYDEV